MGPGWPPGCQNADRFTMESGETEGIREAMKAGLLGFAEETGCRRFIYASCPDDGNALSADRLQIPRGCNNANC